MCIIIVAFTCFHIILKIVMLLMVIIKCYRGTSIVKPSKKGNSSGSESDKESSNSSISLTDDKPKRHPSRPSFISERKSFKVFKSNHIVFIWNINAMLFIFIYFQIYQISNYVLSLKWSKNFYLI